MANTVWNGSDKSPTVTLTGGNLTATGATNTAVRAVDRQIAGKFYWEITLTTTSTLYGHGVARAEPTLTGAGSIYPTPTGAVVVYGTGAIWVNNVNTGVTLGSLGAGGVVLCLAIDLTNRLFWARNGAAGNWNGNAGYSPATGVGGIDVGSVAGGALPVYPVACFGVASASTANFGDTAFVGAVPSGYTSGFTSGASVPTNALASQALAEHWLTTDPQAQVTQVLVEHWQSVASGNLQAVVTQVLIEHWMSVASVSPASGGPQVTMIH